MSLTKEQINEALESNEAKEAIKAAVEKETKALIAKNSELLGSLKEKKDELKSITARIEAIEADKQTAEEQAALKSGDIEKIKAQYEDKIKKLNEDLTGVKSNLESHVIGEGLTQALVRAKIQPGLMEAAKALIRSTYKAEVGENDGKPFAKLDGKAVDEFISGWAQSDTGKHFVLADGNSGGGSNGANGTGKAGTGNQKIISRSEFDALPLQDKATFSKEGGKLTD